MTREELQVLCNGYALIYNKADADSVMDAMEQRIKELEKQLEDVQNTMATENTDLGMENYRLKERIKELEKENMKLESAWLHTTDAVKEQLEEIAELTDRIIELEKVEVCETDQLDLFESED